MKNLTDEQGASLMALEQHFTVAEVAGFLQVSEDTVRRIFSKIPSTLKIERPNGFKRKYVTLRIPKSALEAYLTLHTVKAIPTRRRAA